MFLVTQEGIQHLAEYRAIDCFLKLLLRVKPSNTTDANQAISNSPVSLCGN